MLASPVIPEGQAAGLPGEPARKFGTLGLFEQVMARVNLEVIEDSLILKKPSNTHHYGVLRNGFDTSEAVGHPNRVDYDMFVNWIAEGAACGGSIAPPIATAQCIR